LVGDRLTAGAKSPHEELARNDVYGKTVELTVL
jgi:hypothetical protein